MTFHCLENAIDQEQRPSVIPWMIDRLILQSAGRATANGWMGGGCEVTEGIVM